VLEYNVETKKISSYLKGDNDNKSLDVNELLITKDNTILVASETGLYSMFNRNIQFKKISSNADEDIPDIISKIKSYKETLYVGSWGKGIMQYDKQKDYLTPTKFDNKNNLQPRFIYSLETHNDQMWFSSKNQMGIYKFDHNTKPITLNYYPQFRDRYNNLSSYTVISLLETSNNTFLVGTWDGLLFYYNEEIDEFIILTDTHGNLPLSKDISMNSILEDNEGFIWIGLGGGGVLKLKIDNNQIIQQELITTKQGLVSNFVTTLYQSRNNKIWIGTEAGLTIYENNEYISTFNEDIIFDFQSITEDPIGFLWMGTQKGILRINSNHFKEPYKLFDTSDGLSNNSFYLNSVYAADDYTLYFGGLNGINYFTPYKIEYNFKKPNPKITNFNLFNTALYPTSKKNQTILNKNITLSESIKLNYNQNTFAFEFSNLEYQLQEKCQFSYMLEGVDNDWNYKDADNRYANYTKLSPGNYTFHLKSTNNDGVWSDKPVSISISIAPPIWASTIAVIIYFVFAMVSIFIIIYLRVMKVQQKHQQQLKDVEYRKQKELDELKLRFFTNISHEFRTPLTLILGPLAKILENETNNPFKEKHLMIFRNASRLLQLTNRIMDFRKNEKDQLNLKVQETNISEFIYNIFLFFNYEAQKRNIDYRFKTTFEGSIYADQEFLESIAFNLLSNAFKYTPNDKSITVNISQSLKGVVITISDTGKGIKEEEQIQIFDRFYSSTKRNSAGIGLSFSKRLVELHKSEITVESEFGIGSSFSLTLPIKDVYSDDEKKISQNKETIVDWKKIDQSLQQSLTNELLEIKNLYEKDELIALIVDDNFEIRQFLKSLLENDFKIIEAANGKLALDKAFEQIPDIVISDIMMPEMDGLELCQTLKNDPRTDHIPVILTTVLSAQTDRIEGLSKGADSYIPKPIDPSHLMIRIKKLIEKQLKLKEKFNLQNITTEQNEINEPEKEIHPLVEKAHNIVLQNLDNSEYNIDNFCADLGLSRMQLYRKFKAITGLSANSFIRKVRLHKAAEMLKTGNLTVKEVTYDVGFIDLKYFRKCFNDEFGVNPSEYAQKQL
jgi:signal transduction histidine kinase/DNA-binding response OmpR family regulator|nr:response regulator [Prolixibacteraceae bacterium]